MENSLVEMKRSDEKLVGATLDGDVSAFGMLVERHWRTIVALALTRTSDPSEAEDVAQESFLKAYAQLNRLKDPSRFTGWLSKIALQLCTDAVRRGIRHRTAMRCHTSRAAADSEALAAYSPNPGLSQSQIRFVRETVRQLSEKFRSLIVMRFVGGLSAVQIAEQLGKRPGTVRVWLHRAYRILRTDLAPLLEEVQS
ncbi:MAG: RNA polymerase sigma factor [Sedimentisphaerales bacterium]|nr:RNA polymerase sigma factor [Sedimentisphaerales bacterium]